MPQRTHGHSHTDPSHHIGPCDEACRANGRVHRHREAWELGGGMGEFRREHLSKGVTAVVFTGPQGGPSPSYVRRQARRHPEFRYGATKADIGMPRAKARRLAKLPPKVRARAKAVAAGRVRRTAKGRFIKRGGRR